MADCISALKEWTGKTKATILFDSTVDEFTDDGLFNKVRSKQNVALVGFTTDGDVCGVFYSVAVTEQKSTSTGTSLCSRSSRMGDAKHHSGLSWRRS